ncbi:MAG TPA: protein kinase [Polyangiales bacterium]|nr:protein kinase [Polyangiales bacterium]
MSGQSGSSAADTLIGRVLLGRYRVVRQLAEGGMGIVYLARAEGAAGFRKPVVIKLILAKLSTRPYFIGMFVREAQILAQLRHPGIVDVIEFGEQDGNYVMVLEYVAGFHLGQWCAYLKRRERLVPTELCISIAISVLDALHHVHTQSLPDGTALHITHRDVSPSNILLGPEGYPKLVDFGVARMEADTLYRTEGSGFRGKLAYAAPEMFQGIEAAPQSDLFSCAVVLHELLTGKNEFAGQNQAETLQRVMHHAPQSVHGIRDDAPDEIDAILARALSKTPAERYGSAAEFAQALRRTLKGSEQELRAKLASMLRADFAELADVLGIESLTERDHAWRRFSLLPPAPVARGTAGTGVHDQPTRVLDDLSNERQREASEEALLAKTAAIDEPLVSSAPRAPVPPAFGTQPGGRAGATRWLLWAALAVALAAVAGVTLLALRPAAPQPRVVVLQAERPEAVPAAPSTPAPPAAEPGPSPPPTAPTAVPAAPIAAAVAEPAATARSARATRSDAAPDPAAITRAFRRKQAQVEACFAASSEQLAGPPIEIHFEVDPGGRALQATVFPPQVAASALGACLRKTALATRFPSQGQTVAFRIPVTAKRVAVP